MSSHADILDRPEPITVPFWVSITVHVLVIGGLAASAFVKQGTRINMGSPTGGGLGSVMVSPVASIPLPNRGGMENPVANDTKSQVPTPPAPPKKVKAAPAVKAPPTNAISLPTDKALKKKQGREAVVERNSWREQQKLPDSQIYSNVGQRMGSTTMSQSGGGGVSLGDSSPFGEQFGAYANLIRDNIARTWRPTGSTSRATVPYVVITFTIRRDGSVDKPKVGQSSGISTLDDSALRAVMDAQLPALPPGFPRSQADVEMRFELGK